MSRSGKDSGGVSGTIHGDVSGQVAVGSNISQTQISVHGETPVTPADLETLRELFLALNDRVAREAPQAQRDAALERVAELEEAVTAAEPDLSVMEYAKGWFTKNLPQLAGSVASLVVHPIVGKVVGAAGDTLATEFRRRFGQKS